VQHNANNPEVVDTTGRSYSSRSFAPAGVPFTDQTGKTVSQDVFSSNKNMTGNAVSQSLVLTNPGAEAMKVNVQVAVSDPPQARGSKTQAVTIPPKSSVRVSVGDNVSDKGFTAFKASVTPADDAAKKGKLHVDVAVHAPSEKDPSAMMKQPLMKTEGERGYRVPPDRLSENKAYTQELRYVMRGAKVTPDPVSDKKAWPDAKVKSWAEGEKAKGARGEPTQFDPQVNAGIEGRVNGIVDGKHGSVTAEKLDAKAVASQSIVRVLPNKSPPGFATIDGVNARRPGTASKDAGAYGKAIDTTVPVSNPTDKPITVSVQLKTPPAGQDGAQLPGHQTYNGPVNVSAEGGTVSGATPTAKISQPQPGAADAEKQRSVNVAMVTIPPGKTVNVRVKLETHANSQFPVDVVMTRRS
jgi:hypothetical protein